MITSYIYIEIVLVHYTLLKQLKAYMLEGSSYYMFKGTIKFVKIHLFSRLFKHLSEHKLIFYFLGRSVLFFKSAILNES